MIFLSCTLSDVVFKQPSPPPLPWAQKHTRARTRKQQGGGNSPQQQIPNNASSCWPSIVLDAWKKECLYYWMSESQLDLKSEPQTWSRRWRCKVVTRQWYRGRQDQTLVQDRQTWTQAFRELFKDRVRFKFHHDKFFFSKGKIYFTCFFCLFCFSEIVRWNPVTEINPSLCHKRHWWISQVSDNTE